MRSLLSWVEQFQSEAGRPESAAYRASPSCFLRWGYSLPASPRRRLLRFARLKVLPMSALSAGVVVAELSKTSVMKRSWRTGGASAQAATKPGEFAQAAFSEA